MITKRFSVMLASSSLVAGFLVSYFYPYAGAAGNMSQASSPVEQWKKNDELQSEVLEQQQTNRRLWKDIQNKRKRIDALESQFATQKSEMSHLVHQLQKYRKILGKVAVKGPGITVTLSDNEHIPDGSNPNNYIVHERHIRAVVHELIVSGAEAVAVNGQRISDYSYIKCVGPVVKVDGNKYPAPFVISAVGDPEKMYKSLFLTGNTVDQLTNDNITVKVKKMRLLTIPPYHSQKGR
ncbi:MAG TPA: DUF881 domain-containing protein [Bacillales bacterium]|nr:DUF881 domain-containing protein [Bacillales bacterium]